MAWSQWAWGRRPRAGRDRRPLDGCCGDGRRL